MSDRTYRLYNLTRDGSIQGAVNRDFIDDAEALVHAHQLLAHYPAIEIWQTDRLVGRVDQDTAAA